MIVRTMVVVASVVLAMGCDSAKGQPREDDKSAKKRDDDDPKEKEKPKPDPEVAKRIAVLENLKATPREKVDAADEIGKLGAKAVPQLEASWDDHDGEEDANVQVRVALLFAAGELGEDGLDLVHRGLSSSVPLLRTTACDRAADNAEAVVKNEERRKKMVGLMSLYKSETECMTALLAVAKARKARDGEEPPPRRTADP